MKNTIQCIMLKTARHAPVWATKWESTVKKEKKRPKVKPVNSCRADADANSIIDEICNDPFQRRFVNQKAVIFRSGVLQYRVYNMSRSQKRYRLSSCRRGKSNFRWENQKRRWYVEQRFVQGCAPEDVGTRVSKESFDPQSDDALPAEVKWRSENRCLGIVKSVPAKMNQRF